MVRDLDPSALSVIVTDLFQDGADANLLARSLAESVVATGGAVGVVGLRVPFDGTIYDVGVRRRSFPFEGERPLYILAVGPEGVVGKFVESVRSNVEGAAETRALVLAPSRVARTSTTADASVDSTSGVNETRRLATCGDGTVEPMQFRVLGGDVAVVHADVPLDAVEHGPALAPDNMAAEVHAYRVTESDAVRADPDSSQINAAFSVDVRDAVGGAARVVLSLDERELPSEGLYHATVEVDASSEEAMAWPSWVEDWDMDTLVETPDGSRTLNLQSFVESLARAASSQGDPVVARLEYLFYVGG